MGWPPLPALLAWVMRPPEEVPVSALDAEVLSYRSGAGNRASRALDPLLLPKLRGPQECGALSLQGLRECGALLSKGLRHCVDSVAAQTP